MESSMDSISRPRQLKSDASSICLLVHIAESNSSPLEELNDAQQKAALALVASTLSQKGFEKVEEIREADDVFKSTPHQHPPFGNNMDGGPGHPPFGGAKDGPPGPPPGGGFKGGGPNHEMFGRNLYYLPSWECPRKKNLGCCSSAVTTWRLTSPSWETAPGKNGTSYYRIQGPKLVIEYAPQPGEDHVHTIYRDPTNDYGADQQMKRILVPFSPVSSYR
jgi:hypothetical protein